MVSWGTGLQRDSDSEGVLSDGYIFFNLTQAKKFSQYTQYGPSIDRHDCSTSSSSSTVSACRPSLLAMRRP
jgi:hypothetical protein